jgi:hypothetical protein
VDVDSPRQFITSNQNGFTTVITVENLGIGSLDTTTTSSAAKRSRFSLTSSAALLTASAWSPEKQHAVDLSCPAAAAEVDKEIAALNLSTWTPAGQNIIDSHCPASASKIARTLGAIPAPKTHTHARTLLSVVTDTTETTAVVLGVTAWTDAKRRVTDLTCPFLGAAPLVLEHGYTFSSTASLINLRVSFDLSAAPYLTDRRVALVCVPSNGTWIPVDAACNLAGIGTPASASPTILQVRMCTTGDVAVFLDRGDVSVSGIGSGGGPMCVDGKYGCSCTRTTKMNDLPEMWVCYIGQLLVFSAMVSWLVVQASSLLGDTCGCSACEPKTQHRALQFSLAAFFIGTPLAFAGYLELTPTSERAVKSRMGTSYDTDRELVYATLVFFGLWCLVFVGLRLQVLAKWRAPATALTPFWYSLPVMFTSMRFPATDAFWVPWVFLLLATAYHFGFATLAARRKGTRITQELGEAMHNGLFVIPRWILLFVSWLSFFFQSAEWQCWNTYQPPAA